MKNKSDAKVQQSCCSSSGCCDSSNESNSIGRRHFIGAAGLTAAGLMAGSADLMAGPFKAADFENAIPVDKKLSKEWIAGLYARGEALSATGDELATVGMPISGICTGQVYLAGDGRLWYWNIDGAKNGKINNPKGPSYMKPLKSGSSDVQGFAIQAGGKEFALDASGFKDVKFTNQYPMATVDYADADCPVTIQLQAYTPFIPLNRDDSSYPVVVMRYTITNPTSTDQDVSLAGWVKNISNWKSGKKNAGKKLAVYRELDGITTIECSAKYGNKKLNNSTDAGSIALALLGEDRPEIKDAARTQAGIAGIFTAGDLQNDANVESDATKSAFASLGKQLVLKPGESRTVSFAISWHMPTVQYSKQFGMKFVVGSNHYATQWADATEAAGAVATRESELHSNTQKWTDTWYDSTLPYWFLERTFVTVDCVQTQVGQRLAKTAQTPEYYNFDEGVKCCPGNCTHVWHYAQGLSRIFPEIERECRDKVEFGLGFDAKTGEIHHRYLGGKFHDAIDGNCGTILRVLRESQMTTDYTFLGKYVGSREACDGPRDCEVGFRRGWGAVWCAAQHVGPALVRPSALAHQHVPRRTEGLRPYGTPDETARGGGTVRRHCDQGSARDGGHALERRLRLLHPQAGRRRIGEAWVDQRLSHRPSPRRFMAAKRGYRFDLAGRQDQTVASIAVEVQLHTRRRRVPKDCQRWPLVCRSGRCGASHVQLPARQGSAQEWQRRLQRLSQRVHDWI